MSTAPTPLEPSAPQASAAPTHAGLALALPALSVIALTGLASLYLNWFFGQEWVLRAATPIYLYLVTVQDQPALPLYLALGVVALLVVRLMPESARIHDAMSWLGRHPWWVALAAFPLLALVARYVHHGYSLSMDEYAAWFQAHVFARGHLTAPVPLDWIDHLVPKWHQNQFLVYSAQTGEMASGYWPGFALLVTPFAALGVPWLTNPVIGAVTVGVVLCLTRTVFRSEAAAGWAGVLLLASPVFWAMGTTFYAMGAMLLFNLLFAWALLDPTRQRLMAGGLAGSLALVMHNPVPHLLFALPWWWALWRSPGGWRKLPWLAAGYVPLALLLGYGWPQMTGKLLAAAPAAAAATQAATPTSLFAPLVKVLHQIPTILVMPTAEFLHVRLTAVIKTWSWTTPGLLLLAVVAFFLLPRGSVARRFGWSLLITFAAFMVIRFDQGHGWGFRYVHTAIAALPILVAGAIVACRETAGASLWRDAFQARVVLPLVLAGLLVAVPFRLYQVESFVSWHTGRIPPVPAQGEAIVFVKPRAMYMVDLVQNHPYRENRPLILCSYGEASERAFMQKHFPQARKANETELATVWTLR